MAIPIALGAMIVAWILGALIRHPAPRWTVVGLGAALALSHIARWWT